MSSVLTLYNVILLGAEKADMTYQDASGSIMISGFASKWTNNLDLVAMANAEMSSLWDNIVTAYEDYSLKRKIINTNTNDEEYALPSDFYKLRKVYPIINDVRYKPLRKFDMNLLGEDIIYDITESSVIHDVRYKINGSKLWLFPKPPVGELEIWYIPQFEPMYSMQAPVPHIFPVGWEDYVAEGLAARLLEKEESDPSVCLRRQGVILDRILGSIKDRDTGEPYKIKILDAGYDYTI